MEWRDVGLVLSARRHGERDCILEVMTEAHGRHLGLVRSGRSPRIAPMLQAGNRVSLVWRARLEDHLGTFTAETLEGRAGHILASPLALHGMAHLAQLIRLLPERDPHPAIYQVADAIATLSTEPLLLAASLVRFEALVLAELGFGLDLGTCAATGKSEDLVYVSPKSGRAVCREAGEPWANRMLSLPAFLVPQQEAIELGVFAKEITGQDLLAGFELTGFFLRRHVFEPRGIVDQQARGALINLLKVA